MSVTNDRNRRTGRRGAWLRLVPVLLLLCSVAGIARQRAAEASFYSQSPPDTWNGIHTSLTFNYAEPRPTGCEQAEYGVVDDVWGATGTTPSYPLPVPAPGTVVNQQTNIPACGGHVYHEHYFPFGYDGYAWPHGVAWFRQNHPDWLMYQNDKASMIFQQPVPYPTTIRNDDPVLYYRLHELSGTTVHDDSVINAQQPNAGGQGPNTGTYVNPSLITYSQEGVTQEDDAAIALPAQPGTTAGSYAYVSTPSLSLGSSFSLEAWVNPNNYLPTGQYQETIFASTAGGDLLAYAPASNGSRASQHFFFQMGSTGFYSTDTFPAGSWYHVVYTWDAAASQETLYVNGVQEGTHTVNPSTEPVPNWGGVSYLGASPTSSSYPAPLSGSLDEVAIYNKALSATQVSTHYSTASQTAGPGTSQPALDYTNPAVLNYLVQDYIDLYLSSGGYDGISIDNNPSQNPFGIAGHYDASGNWVQQYSGNLSDPAYANAMATALQSIIAQVPYTATYTTNNGLNCYVDLSLWSAASNAADQVADEKGFEDGYGASTAAYTTSAPLQNCTNAWKQKVDTYVSYQTTAAQRGIVLNWYAPTYTCPAGSTCSSTACTTSGTVTTCPMYPNITNDIPAARADVQWNLANYLLIKYHHTYLDISQGTHKPESQPEYTAASSIGSPVSPVAGGSSDYYSCTAGSCVNPFVSVDGTVYLRSYSGGLALVNPDPSATRTVTLTPGLYRDLYGNVILSPQTLGPHSGLVLLTSPYAATVVGDGPAAYYRFEESSGSTANDTSGNNRTGTYHSNATTGASATYGVSGPGASVDGDKAISLPGDAGAYVASRTVSLGSAFSLEAWVNPQDYLGTGQYMETILASSGGLLAYCPLSNGGSAKQKFLFQVGGNYLATSSTFPAGPWYHVVYTWDPAANAGAGVQSLYVNGVLQATSGPFTAGPSWGTTTYAGVTVTSTNFPDPLKGSLDEVAVYGKALTATQVSNHYAAYVH